MTSKTLVSKLMVGTFASEYASMYLSFFGCKLSKVAHKIEKLSVFSPRSADNIFP